MSNHDVPCEHCGEDIRAGGGVHSCPGSMAADDVDRAIRSIVYEAATRMEVAGVALEIERRWDDRELGASAEHARPVPAEIQAEMDRISPRRDLQVAKAFSRVSVACPHCTRINDLGRRGKTPETFRYECWACLAAFMVDMGGA